MLKARIASALFSLNNNIRLNPLWVSSFSRNIATTKITDSQDQEEERKHKDERNMSGAPAPIYELRIYNIYPKEFRKVVELFQKYIGVRTNHSKLVGFWNGEIGGAITQLVHIWEYDSLSHRRKVRTSMMDDKVWTTAFLPNLLPCMDTWTNSLMGLVPNTRLNLDFPAEAGSVYLLETIQNSDIAKKVISGIKGEHLVGRFVATLGPFSTEYRLWRYQTIDTLLFASWNKQLDLHYNRTNTPGNSLMLYPLAFSPLQ